MWRTTKLAKIGHEAITDALAAGAGVCTANIAEVTGVLTRRGLTAEQATQAVVDLPVAIFDVDLDLARRAGVMELGTRRFGLSLGDRICLALAAKHGLPAMTKDSVWAPNCACTAGQEIAVGLPSW